MAIYRLVLLTHRARDVKAIGKELSIIQITSDFDFNRFSKLAILADRRPASKKPANRYLLLILTSTVVRKFGIEPNAMNW
jgi:hypothetical protein